MRVFCFSLHYLFAGFVAIFLTVFFVTFVTVKSQTLSEEETCSNLSGSGSGSDSIMSFAGETADYADCSLKMFAPSVQTFLALPTISFSFVCHTSVLPVFHELQEADEMGRSRRSHKRIMKAVHVSLLIALVLYSVGAFFGYYTFREKTNQVWKKKKRCHRNGMVPLRNYVEVFRVECILG